MLYSLVAADKDLPVATQSLTPTEYVVRISRFGFNPRHNRAKT